MKRFFGVLAALLVTISFLSVQTAAADTTNNFRITSYDIQYELSRDSESRSALKTSETIVAQFSTFDYNHGIERAIPKTYNGHPIDLEITKVTDEKGNDWEYSTYSQKDMTVLRIGDPDAYVHGAQTFHIEYSQRDVTRYFANTERDEWYWDTNGTGWKVPINQLTVSVVIDESLADARAGEPMCYQGAEGATDSCQVGTTGTSEYTVQATNLAAGENVTLAFGFKQGTFAEYVASPYEVFAKIWVGVQIVSIVLTVILSIVFGVLFSRRSNRTKEQNPIVAEYIPPKDTSVLVASKVGDMSLTVFSAQLIDLAVRRYISIIETRPKSTWKSAEYDIVITKDIASLLDEEKEILTDMFDGVPAVGGRIALSKLRSSVAYMRRTRDNDAKLQALIEKTYGIREKSPKASKLFYRWASILLIVGFLTLSPAFGIGAFVLWLMGIMLRPLTDKGLQLRRYILGLDKYIKASETERLKFLQGPDTAQKVGYDVDPGNPGQLVKLYERVLPYAILFGYEQQWAKRLGDFYQESGSAPDWYAGSAPFSAAVFASSLHNFSETSSYSGGSSSSTGGSSGGGSSGGGGGGGGGGGW